MRRCRAAHAHGQRDAMNRQSAIVIGAGGHAHACIDVIEQHGGFDIAGLIGLPEEMHSEHFGYAVIATDDDLPALAAEYPVAFVALGQIATPDARIRLFLLATKLGFALPTVVAADAFVSAHASIGPGTMVMHGAIVNAGATVGRNCIVNSRALVEHDASVGDHCHVSTGAILNGKVTVGAGSFIGSGAILKDGVSVGERCLIGMGLCVRHDQAAHTRLAGQRTS